ncbi:MAG: SOS response-associated peptidase family protein [Puniceicoccaceae bacterium]
MRPLFLLTDTGRTPNARGIHHRAPVLVRPERRGPWLDRKLAGDEAIRKCAFPGEKENLRRHPVSDRVNRVAENDPGPIRAIDPQPVE